MVRSAQVKVSGLTPVIFQLKVLWWTVMSKTMVRGPGGLLPHQHTYIMLTQMDQSRQCYMSEGGPRRWFFSSFPTTQRQPHLLAIVVSKHIAAHDVNDVRLWVQLAHQMAQPLPETGGQEEAQMLKVFGTLEPT